MIEKHLIHIAAQKALRADKTSSRAFLSAAAQTTGEAVTSKKGIAFCFTLSDEETAERVKRLCDDLYRIRTEEEWQGKIKLLTVSPEKAYALLMDLQVIDMKGRTLTLTQSVPSFVTGDIVKQYVLSLLLLSGNLYLPSNGEKGYALEFVFKSENFAQSVQQLLGSCVDFTFKYSERKGAHIVYLKDKEKISDFFAYLSMPSLVLKIQNLITERQRRNDINRGDNCILANIDKAVTAASKQIEAIEFLQQRGVILNDKLQEAAQLRLKYPEMPLSELTENADGCSKSGLNHRLRKIVQMADAFKTEEEK